jgi:O-antigen/teichoic acid export membrane protein
MAPLPSSPLRRTADGTVWVSLARLLLIPTGFVITVFLTRRLGPRDYGLFTLVAVLMGWVEMMTAALFERTTIRFVGQAEDWEPIGTAVLRLYLAVGFGSLVILWLLASPIARLLNEPVLATYVRLYALGMPLSSLSRAHTDVLVGLGQFRWRAFTVAGYWIARLVLIVALVGVGLSVAGAILGSICAPLIVLIVARFYVRPRLLGRTSFSIRRLWGYAVPLFFFALSLRFFSKVDLFALKALSGTAAQAGVYGAAQSLTRLPGIFVGALSPLLLSTMSGALPADQDRLARRMARDAMRVVVLLLPVGGLTAGAASEIVRLVFGLQYASTAPLLALLIFGALGTAMISVTTAILTAADHPAWTFGLMGPLLLLAVAGHLALIPRLGAMGAALVTTLVATLGGLGGVMAVHRVLHVFPPMASALRSVVICALAYGFASLWSTAGFLLLFKLATIVLFVVLAFRLSGEFTSSEIALARSMVRWPVARDPNRRRV